MKDNYRAVVIGGGVVGASVLYHLSKLGWSDIALVERSELTSGSTWHAAAGFHVFNSDPNLAALQKYTIGLYPILEKESGQSCGMHVNGGIHVASTPIRHEALKAELSAFKAVGIHTAQLISPKEIRELTHGIVRTDDLLCGLYDTQQGYLDPNGTTHAYVKAAQRLGAAVILRNRVIELTQLPGGEWKIVTEQGTIKSENIINAAGLWAKKVGLMADIDLPVTPMEHHYIVTDTLPSIRNKNVTIPTVVDSDKSIYARQEGKGLLVGLYESNPVHWQMDGAPWNYGIELIPENIDRVGEELYDGFTRFPELVNIGIRRWVNGAFTFAPDGNPLVGPCSSRGYWVACGVMAGFSQAGGVGKSLAEWIIHGEPEDDVYGMDVARFGPHHSNKEYIRQTTRQFYQRRMVMTFPNEELPAGRTLRTSGAHADMTNSGARWGNNWGMESPLYFAPSKSFVEAGTMLRSADFSLIADECMSAQESVCLMDISGYSRFCISGPMARSWVDNMLPSRTPEAGKIRIAPMLSSSGRLMGDLTCFNWDDREFWLMGSYRLREWHMRWFNTHLKSGVEIKDVSDNWGGFALIGPKSRDVLQKLTDIEVKNIGFMNCISTDVGLNRVRIGRLSLTGELTFELNCKTSEHAPLRKQLLAAGSEFAIKEIGFRAASSMRLEKSIGVWGAEFAQQYTPRECGLDRWIAWEKGTFIGRKAAEVEQAPDQKLCTLAIDTNNADASGFEPVYANGNSIGYTTSGGFGHRCGKSLAIAMIKSEFVHHGTELVVDVVGEAKSASVIPDSPYDPSGNRMRI